MDIIKYLPKQYRNHIICICKTGSQLLVDNCNDIDYLIVTDLPFSKRLHYIHELKADCFIYGVKRFKRVFTDDKSIFKLIYCLAYNNPKNVLYGELPKLETNIFSKEYLTKTVLPIEYAWAEKTYFVKYPLKSMVWGLALYYVIINNSFDFTNEQKEILQKAHDLELPLTYCDELKTNMQKLLSSVE